MANDIILDPGSGGATLSTFEDAGNAHHQEIIQEFLKVGGTTPTRVSETEPLPVIMGLESPQSALATTAGLAAGSSTDLDGTQITSAKTGKLVGIIATASVAIKVELKTVLNATPSSTLAVFFIKAGDGQPILMPSREFYTVAHDVTAGLDAFRVTITNLDTSVAADVYCTFLWDEV